MPEEHNVLVVLHSPLGWMALIGAGHLAQNQHLPNLMWTTHARLKTVCDVRQEAVSDAQKQFCVPNGETDYRKVLADPEIQGVVIATQAKQHEELVSAALRAGKRRPRRRSACPSSNTSSRKTCSNSA